MNHSKAGFGALGATTESVEVPPYEPEAYWSGKAGDIYESTCNEEGYAPQEAALARVLADLDWATVLDVGCGFGRLAKVVFGVRPDAFYTGLDVSPGQIANAIRRLPNEEFHLASLLGFDADGRTWDLVLSAECLMHQPGSVIRSIIPRLLSWSSAHVVTLDWDDVNSRGSEWCFPHDYAALYGPRLVSSQRVGEVWPWDQQSIFVASP